MSKLFSPLSLLDESRVIITIESTDSYNDDSYFIETLNFLTEQNKKYTHMNAVLYKNINESGNDPIVVREAFSDFFSDVKDFIKKVIKFLKNLLAKFWVRINSLFMRDKYIESHKADLAKFTSTHEFDIQGYTYKFEPDLPSISPLQDFTRSIEAFKLSSSPDKSKKANYQSFLDEKNANTYLNNIRQACIKAKNGISENDFKDELFKVFRSGDSSKSKITVTSTVVNSALSFFSNYETMKKDTQRHSDGVEKEYVNIQRQLDNLNKLISNSSDDVTVTEILDGDKSSDNIAICDLFMKAKTQEITTISNMHLMAFSAKLDALKERFGQDKSILYGSFKKILAKNEDTNISEDLEHDRYNPYAGSTDEKDHHGVHTHDFLQYKHHPDDSPSMKARKDKLRLHAAKSLLSHEAFDLSLVPDFIDESEFSTFVGVI